MYARVTTVQFDPAKLAELTAKTNELKAGVKKMKGVINTYSVWRADGLGVVTAIFDTKASADAAAEQAKAIWGGLAGILKGAPKTEVFDNVEHLSG
jgi:hypothetical protein